VLAVADPPAAEVLLLHGGIRAGASGLPRGELYYEQPQVHCGVAWPVALLWSELRTLFGTECAVAAANVEEPRVEVCSESMDLVDDADVW